VWPFKTNHSPFVGQRIYNDSEFPTASAFGHTLAEVARMFFFGEEKHFKGVDGNVHASRLLKKPLERKRPLEYSCRLSPF
jgi:hypothetical protein